MTLVASVSEMLVPGWKTRRTEAGVEYARVIKGRPEALRDDIPVLVCTSRRWGRGSHWTHQRRLYTRTRLTFFRDRRPFAP